MKLPIYIDIELNTSCQLSCQDCPYKEDHKKPEFMKWDLYKTIIDQIDWKASIKLCQRGEPLLSPILVDAIYYANDKGLRTVINTNGLRLTHQMVFNLINSGLEALILSDYGLEKQFLNGKSFSYLNYISGKKPINFIVKTTQPKKWEGIPDVIVEPVFYDYSNTTDDFTELPNWKCEQLFERLIIEPDGMVRCCCGYIHIDKYVGKVFFNTIKDIWNSTKLNEYRKLHLEGKSHELEMCRQCAYRKSIIKERSEK